MPKSSAKAHLERYRQKRDFRKTPEPSGDVSPPPQGEGLRFVIQKHDASHLHYDLRLEMEGVMRSWAVPKGPSVDPNVRRLAMEVEDHPISYNDFEGTIPAGEYGGGTVMLWDVGTYEADEAAPGEENEAAVLRGYRKGKLSITFHGERLRGSFALVRTETVEGGIRSKWLFLKHRDAEADASYDITEEVVTSVVTGRTMEEIASGVGGDRVWRSNRGASGEDANKASAKAGGKAAVQKKDDAAKAEDRKVATGSLLPMLATGGADPPTRGEWSYEPKYDGIRVLAFATPKAVTLVTRNGNDKARQFPEVVKEVSRFVKDLGKPVVLDGEIVALEGGEIVRFESLQGRMHIADGRRAERLSEDTPTALVAFDVLLVGDRVLMSRPWTERREALEEILSGRETQQLRISETTADYDELLERAEREGWEGVMAKRRDARYRPGQRSPDWLKLKLENRQELVVGGWTEPRNSRTFIGALLLGYFENGDFIYAGHTGTGFNRKSLEEMHRRLKKIEQKSSPFKTKPPTNQPAHWTTPTVVVEVKFTEWTKDGKLRHPVFVGVRDDKDAREVVREPKSAGAERLRAAGAGGGRAQKDSNRGGEASAPRVAAGAGAASEPSSDVEEPVTASGKKITPRKTVVTASADRKVAETEGAGRRSGKGKTPAPAAAEAAGDRKTAANRKKASGKAVSTGAVAEAAAKVPAAKAVKAKTAEAAAAKTAKATRTAETAKTSRTATTAKTSRSANAGGLASGNSTPVADEAVERARKPKVRSSKADGATREVAAKDQPDGPSEVKAGRAGAAASARNASASPEAPVKKKSTAGSVRKSGKTSYSDEELDTPVAARIRELRRTRKDGALKLDTGESIGLSSFEKVFYPATGHTKGDVLIYYARMGELILPWMKDRPLVLKRFPNGVEGESFYQQAAPDSVPRGVRVETLHIEEKDQRRLVGGNLATLLYTIQLGAISFDPWHSRIQALKSADYTILDLDPGPGVDFQGVVQVARWVKEEMDRLGLHGALKTSGSSGIHIYLPLAPRTPLEAATLVAQIVATRVAKNHPELATVERMRTNRPHGTVYVDYLQNILGKTVAGVYAVRAKRAPTVSTPLSWDELTDDLDLQAFTIDTVPARVRQVGDLWSPAMATPNSLEGLKRKG